MYTLKSGRVKFPVNKKDLIYGQTLSDYPSAQVFYLILELHENSDIIRSKSI